MIERVRNITLVVLGIVVGIAAASFIAENQQPIVVELLWSEAFVVELPLWSIAAIAFGAGVTLASILTLLGAWSRRKTLRALKRQVRDMGAELTHLRNLPLENLPAVDHASRPNRQRSFLPQNDGLLGQAELLPPRSEEAGDIYEAFLDDGEGFDAAEAPSYLRGDTRKDVPEAGDPYALLFDRVDPVVRDMDEAELYPAVLDRNREGRG